MKLSKMKIECPICQTRIKQVRKDDKTYWAECPHQCVRIRHNLSGKITSYIVKVHIDNKDYQFYSSRLKQSEMFGGYNLQNTDDEVLETSVSIYKHDPETDKWSFKLIMKLNTYTDFEEVANNPWKATQRLLNVKAFA